MTQPDADPDDDAGAARQVEGEGSRGLGHLLRHSLNYSLVPLLGRAISLVMLFFFADWLKEQQFGMVDLAELLLAMLVQAFGYNLLSGMTRYYFDREDPKERAAVVSSCTLLIAAMAWGVIGLMLPFRDELAPILISGEAGEVGWKIKRLMLISLLIIPFQLTTQCGLYYLQIQKRSGVFAVIQVTKMLFELSMRVYLVGFAGEGAIGYLKPVLYGEAIATIFLTGWMLKQTGVTFSWKVLKPIVFYTLPLVPVGVFQLLLHYGDRRLLEFLVPSDKTLAHVSMYGDGLSQVGIYGVGYKIGFLTTAAMLGPFVQIFHPWIYDEPNPEVQGRNLSRISTYCILALTAASIGIVLIVREFLYFMPDDKNYIYAWKVVPFIASGYLFWGLYHLTQIPLYIKKRTAPLIGINAAAVVANVCLNFALVPRFGFIGSGFATLGTFMVLAGMGVWMSRRVMNIPFELKRLALCLVAMSAASAVALLIDRHYPPLTPTELAVAVAVKFAIFLVFTGLLWRFVLHQEERRDFVAWLRARLGRAELS